MKDASVPLQSMRLALQAGQLECHICGENNTQDSELCIRCQAPMELARQAVRDQVAPTMIAVLGPSGVGKTVYLGMLMDMLSRQTDRHNLHLLARGAFSISLQQETSAALSRCEFPSKTPNEPDRWHWIHCQVHSRLRRRPVELVMPDMAGESLLAEIDHPHTYPVVRSFLNKCSGALVLIDSVKLRQQREQDYYAMKLVTYLAEMNGGRKGWRRKPLAFVLSKADESEECFQDPTGFARTHAWGLWRHCSDRFRTFQFFASGVAGACAERDAYRGRIRVPLRIEPRGIIEPFEWLMENLPR